MAGTSLLALIDDIATILDDVSVMTKVAVKKTSGVLGDDLALNAEQVTGVNADRELPVVFSVAKGSLINKVILVPMALAINAFIPVLIAPLLMIGGAFLCFEGFEKIFEKLFPHKDHTKEPREVLSEESKIKGAVKTDFILSAEIIVITLGSLGETTLLKSFLVLSGVSLLMTVGVYGLVALIVKLDDIGLFLTKKPGAFNQKFGIGLINFMPVLMKFLGIAGTAAMFLVGGGIITHNIPVLHHLTEAYAGILPTFINAIAGIVTGGVCFVLFEIYQKIRKQR